MAGRFKSSLAAASPGAFEIRIDNLSHEGAGIARQPDGKTIFIADALPGETVRYHRTQSRRDFDQGKLLEVVTASAERITPACPHLGVCGGCALQHLEPRAQVEFKQRSLLDTLARIARVQPEQVLSPLVGSAFGYRRRARFTLRYDHKAARIHLGFLARDGHEVAPLDTCLVLAPIFGERIAALTELISALSIHDKIPQLEVAVADNAAAMSLRVLRQPNRSDRELLITFSRATGIWIWLQASEDAEPVPLLPDTPSLAYRLAAHNVELQFAPTDFVQVNAELNEKMVDQALSLLALQPHEQVLDLFAGIGNFSLPMARQKVKRVVTVEGESRLAERARHNAALNGLDNVDVHLADLNTVSTNAAWLKHDYDAVLLDPPRTGARAMMPLIAAHSPRRILYVSCHPGTLARDAALLVHEHGYRLRAAGIVDMFPHTSHVESMALFEHA